MIDISRELVRLYIASNIVVSTVYRLKFINLVIACLDILLNVRITFITHVRIEVKNKLMSISKNCYI